MALIREEGVVHGGGVLRWNEVTELRVFYQDGRFSHLGVRSNGFATGASAAQLEIPLQDAIQQVDPARVVSIRETTMEFWIDVAIPFVCLVATWLHLIQWVFVVLLAAVLIRHKPFKEYNSLDRGIRYWLIGSALLSWWTLWRYRIGR